MNVICQWFNWFKWLIQWHFIDEKKIEQNTDTYIFYDKYNQTCNRYNQLFGIINNDISMLYIKKYQSVIPVNALCERPVQYFAYTCSSLGKDLVDVDGTCCRYFPNLSDCFKSWQQFLPVILYSN